MRPRLLWMFLALPLLAAAQARHVGSSNGPWPLVSARAVGSQRFAEADIIAAAGLKVGANATTDAFRQGADKLAASGAFEQVGYKYGPVGGGVMVQFNVADAPQFLPALFDNFVWYSDQQLTAAVHARVPLFHGELPADGDMTTQVTDALQALLAERGIPGQVRFQLQEEKLGAPISGGIFHVDGIQVRIREVTFPGAAAAEEAPLAVAVKPMLDMSFRRSTVEAFVAFNLRPVYLRRGFLKVGFGKPAVTLVSDDPRAPVVSLAMQVIPGLQYRLGALRWSGNQAIRSLDLDKLLSLPVGAPADLMALRAGLDKVNEAYRARGYLRQTARELPTYDDSVQVVSYELQVNEGEQYKFGGVEIQGLEPRLRDRIREVWSLREGEPYDPNYVKTFLRASAPLLGPGVVTRVQQEIDDQRKAVQVTLHFEARKPK